jgi:LysR family hydrogen peroxide-inducible transcriptional activator
MALPYPSPDTTQRHLFHDRFQLACQERHPLARSGDLHTVQLEGEELLLLEEGHCIREHALSACNLRSADYGRPYQLTSLHTLVQMVANGLGITLLPEMAIRAGILTGTQLTVKAFADEQVSRSIGLVWRKTHTRSDELDLLADSIQDIWSCIKGSHKGVKS